MSSTETLVDYVIMESVHDYDNTVTAEATLIQNYRSEINKGDE